MRILCQRSKSLATTYVIIWLRTLLRHVTTAGIIIISYYKKKRHRGNGEKRTAASWNDAHGKNTRNPTTTPRRQETAVAGGRREIIKVYYRLRGLIGVRCCCGQRNFSKFLEHGRVTPFPLPKDHH